MRNRNLSFAHTVLILCILAFSIASCKKAVDSVTSLPNDATVKVENGIIVFKTISDLSNYRSNAYNLSSTERKKIEAEMGFSSLASFFEKISEDIEGKENSSEIEEILSPYKDLFEYTESGLKYKNDNFAFAYIVDKNGYFKIGKALYRSINNGRVISTTTAYELLKSISTVDDYLAKATDEIKIDWFSTKEQFLGTPSRNAAGPYSSGTNTHYLISVRNESNNRRLYVDMIFYNTYVAQYSPIDNYYMGFTYQNLLTLGFSHRRKGAFGIWSQYTSPTYISELKLRYHSPPFVGPWNLHFSGTLNNNSSGQSYSNYSVPPFFGLWSGLSSYPASRAQTWVEPKLAWDVSITCTGNGQSWYTNQYWYQ